MKEKLTFLMLMIMASALFSSCDQKMKELKEQVDKFNKACPMSFGDIMTLNSTMLDNDVVEMKLTANETVASISALNNHQEEAKEILTMSLSKETSNVLVDKIINADAIMPYIYKSVILVLAIFGGCFIFSNVVNVIKDLFFKSKDTSITNNLIDKSLFTKDPKKLAQENNKEIQKLTEDVEFLKTNFKTINEKLNYIMEELANRG